jgi:hypothetical protein
VRSQRSNFKAKREATLELDTGETSHWKAIALNTKRVFLLLLLVSLPQKDVWHSQEIQLISLIDLSYIWATFYLASLWKLGDDLTGIYGEQQMLRERERERERERVISDIYEIIEGYYFEMSPKGIFSLVPNSEILMSIAHARCVLINRIQTHALRNIGDFVNENKWLNIIFLFTLLRLDIRHL